MLKWRLRSVPVKRLRVPVLTPEGAPGGRAPVKLNVMFGSVVGLIGSLW
jgi:hypothetical protein